jgi:hypothetical protein
LLWCTCISSPKLSYSSFATTQCSPPPILKPSYLKNHSTFRSFSFRINFLDMESIHDTLLWFGVRLFLHLQSPTRRLPLGCFPCTANALPGGCCSQSAATRKCCFYTMVQPPL